MTCKDHMIPQGKAPYLALESPHKGLIQTLLKSGRAFQLSSKYFGIGLNILIQDSTLTHV